MKKMNFHSKRTTRLKHINRNAKHRQVKYKARAPRTQYTKGPRSSQLSKGAAKGGPGLRARVKDRAIGVKLGMGMKGSAIARRGNNSAYSGYYAGGPSFL